MLLIWLGLRERPEPLKIEDAAQWIETVPEIQSLLSSFGYDPDSERESARAMEALVSSIRAEITDYESFCAAVSRAVQRSRTIAAADGSFAILDALNDAPDISAAHMILNADPIGGQVPLVELIPVMKGGTLTWQSPVDHSLIRRLPADLPRFITDLDRLEHLYSRSRPARSEALRLDVIEAVARVRRELERDKAYLPASLQFLQTKLAEYRAKSLRPGAAESIAALLALLNRLAPGSSEIAKEASFYLANPELHTPWLTNRILTLALRQTLAIAPGQRIARRARRRMDFVRREIAAGHYDPTETAQRLHTLEIGGFDIMSLVYPLLRISPAKSVQSPGNSGR